MTMFRIIVSAILLIVLAVLVVLNLESTTSVNLFGREFADVSVVAIGLLSFVAGVVYSFIIYVGNYIARARRERVSKREKTVKAKEKADKKSKKALPAGSEAASGGAQAGAPAASGAAAQSGGGTAQSGGSSAQDGTAGSGGKDSGKAKKKSGKESGGFLGLGKRKKSSADTNAQSGPSS